MNTMDRLIREIEAKMAATKARMDRCYAESVAVIRATRLLTEAK